LILILIFFFLKKKKKKKKIKIFFFFFLKKKKKKNRITTVSISLLRSVFEKILSAISVLHQNGIAHGYLSLDSVIIAEELLNYSSITPTILGFEYALKDQKNGNKEAETENWEAPEARTSDFPLISVDIWDFANMICEAFR